MRTAVQARDIFDLYIFSSQYVKRMVAKPGQKLKPAIFLKAKENVFDVSFEQFRDTVVSYLASEDQSVYAAADAWDDIKLKASDFIDEIGKNYA